MRRSIIVAMGLNRQIGIEGRIPWHLSADLQNFKKVTMGHTLLLGRKTFESIGKALPGRKTIVLSQNAHFKAPGCLSAASIKDAIAMAKDSGETELFIAGGAAVYASALDLADRLYLTVVDYAGVADTFFPSYSTEGWKNTFSHAFPGSETDPCWHYDVWDKG